MPMYLQESSHPLEYNFAETIRYHCNDESCFNKNRIIITNSHVVAPGV